MSCDPNPVGTWTYAFLQLVSSGSSQWLEPGSQKLSEEYKEQSNTFDTLINSNTLLYAQLTGEESEETLALISSMQNFYVQLAQTNSELYMDQIQIENIEIYGAYALFFILYLYCLFL